MARVDLTYRAEYKGAQLTYRPLVWSDRDDFTWSFLFMPYSGEGKGTSMSVAQNSFGSLLQNMASLEWDAEKLLHQPGQPDWRICFALERTGSVVGFFGLAGHAEYIPGVAVCTFLCMHPDYKGTGMGRPLFNGPFTLGLGRLGYTAIRAEFTEDSPMRKMVKFAEVNDSVNPDQLRGGQLNEEVKFERFNLPLYRYTALIRNGVLPNIADLNGTFTDPLVEALLPRHLDEAVSDYILTKEF